MANRDPRDESLKSFRLFDDDETGTISLKNLRRVAKELGENMTDDELQEVIDFCDKDGRGEISQVARAAVPHAARPRFMPRCARARPAPRCGVPSLRA